MRGAILGVTIFMGLAFYCLPTIIGEVRRIKHDAGIVWVNLIFGWTVFGWIAALRWALAEKDSPKSKRLDSGSAQADAWNFQAQRLNEDSAISQDDCWVLGIEDFVESARNGRSNAGTTPMVRSEGAIPDDMLPVWLK